MNEPSNFCNGLCDAATYKLGGVTGPNNPPYAINNKFCTAPLSRNTLSMDAKQYLSTHYNMHNLFGISVVLLT